MTILQSILLGLLQGVAEFLPISSSGHLKVAQCLFGLEEVPVLFDIFLHLATLLAVIIFFRKKIWDLLCAFFRIIFRRPAPLSVKDKNGQTVTLNSELAKAKEKNLRNFIIGVILATVVTGAIGIVVKKVFNDFENVNVKLICAGFVITAIVLIVSSIIGKRQAQIKAANGDDENLPVSAEEKAPSWYQSLLIGLAQGIGTLPGISRSGSTIAGGLFCGVNRSMAGEFSFIASIPAILGAFILDVKDIGEVLGTVGVMPLVAGCVTSFVSGYLSLAFLMKLIKKGKLEWFAAYLIPAGILGMIFLH